MVTWAQARNFYLFRVLSKYKTTGSLAGRKRPNLTSALCVLVYDPIYLAPHHTEVQSRKVAIQAVRAAVRLEQTLIALGADSETT